MEPLGLRSQSERLGQERLEAQKKFVGYSSVIAMLRHQPKLREADGAIP